MNKMNNEIQKLIDGTDYWDAEILDLKASYFGDEVEMHIECKNIFTEKISKSNLELFWTQN